ncbi:hypothetical protein KOAAANKH_01914 [Brevundimonas sp. NIBR10]|uniref:nuclear transport factor 2 family protein n=1 Tax=Brevundimonas sp. NIBR10 TaxID=3015997 RepID=UPI0022F196DF|nr:nuclear transport factor 2 family protein [Brevundimonas sp. NIBR10]WGM47040.1 hypothetical protein KOAAANKH_01914 [Brevundimonas sp. NIBR10]
MSMLALGLALALQTATTPEAEVAAVLDRLNVASSAADGPAYFALFTPDARFIGTDASEHWSRAEFQALYEPYFASGKGWSYPATARTITLAPIDCRCVAWFEEKLVNAKYGETRGSGVLRLVDGQWKIEQYVLSFSVPNDRSDAVIAAIKADPAP